MRYGVRRSVCRVCELLSCRVTSAYTHTSLIHSLGTNKIVTLVIQLTEWRFGVCVRSINI